MALDRISELPESFIHDQIMSRLSRRDRARTKVLSKTWYHLNKTYPALDFDFECFFTGLCKGNPELFGAIFNHSFEFDYRHDSPEFRKSLQSFTARADKSLLRFSRRNLSLQSLRVKFGYGYYAKYESDLRMWIESALDNKVEKLKLYCPRSYRCPKYSLPQQILKKLTLSDCQINNDPLVLKQTDCPALESLALRNCYGFDSIHITDLVRLHTVKIELTRDTKIVEIASHTLQKLSIEGYGFEHYPSAGINIYGCSCLKFLHLYSNAITDQFHDLLSKLPLLEDLYVTGWIQIDAMQVSSPRLKTLLVSPYKTSCLKSIDIKVPTIKNFIFSPDSEEHIKIKVQADCCLETLVLSGINKQIDKLVAEFPLLQSLSIFSCHELETIEIPNVDLKRLHIAECSKLRDVKVASRKVEMYCRDRDDLKISTPDPNYMMQSNT